MLDLIFFTSASIINLLTGASTTVTNFLVKYGYAAIIILMGLESASLPIPSEVVLPLIGKSVAEGTLNAYLAFACTMIGTAIGISVDYAIAYYLGKDVIYKHLNFFHVKRETIDSFEEWFRSNGSFAVFISRLLPVVRGLISIPAGFAEMPLKKFFFYSLVAAAIWNAALMYFGYAVLSTTNAQLLFGGIGVFAIVLYLIYHFSLDRIKKSGHRK